MHKEKMIKKLGRIIDKLESERCLGQSAVQDTFGEAIDLQIKKGHEHLEMAFRMMMHEDD